MVGNLESNLKFLEFFRNFLFLITGKSNITLVDFTEVMVDNQSENIFIIFDSNRISSGDLCSIESAAFHHPYSKVFAIFQQKFFEEFQGSNLMKKYESLFKKEIENERFRNFLKLNRTQKQILNPFSFIFTLSSYKINIFLFEINSYK
jgi:hypothetical protein